MDPARVLRLEAVRVLRLHTIWCCAHVPTWRRGDRRSKLPDAVCCRSRFVVERHADSEPWVAEHRARLSSLTWFMKLFKQRLARRSNAVDGVSGRFWESRFLSVPLLDNGAVFGWMAYVDRNPMRARMVTDPADALFTSIAHRLCAVGSGRAASFFHEDDCRLGACLTPLSACHPVDPVTGGFSNAAVTLDEYRVLVVPGSLSSATRTVCQGLTLYKMLKDVLGIAGALRRQPRQ